MTSSSDASSQHAIIDLLSLTGSRFTSVLPLSAEIELPENVEMVYATFSQAAQKEERGGTGGTKLVYPLCRSFTKVAGGLSARQKASQGVFDGGVRGKVIIDSQE